MNTYSYDPHARHCLAAIFQGRLDDAVAKLKAHPELVRNRNNCGESPLHYLAIENELEGVRLLLAHGADPSSKCLDGASVLMDAASLGLTEVVSELIQHGADVHAGHWLTHETALHRAAQHLSDERDDRVISVLVAGGCDIEARSHLGDTPLKQAVEMGNTRAVAALLAHGANPNACDDWGGPVLSGIAPSGNVEVLELLVRGGANLDAVHNGIPIRASLARISPQFAARIAALDAERKQSAG